MRERNALAGKVSSEGGKYQTNPLLPESSPALRSRRAERACPCSSCGIYAMWSSSTGTTISTTSQHSAAVAATWLKGLSGCRCRRRPRHRRDKTVATRCVNRRRSVHLSSKRAWCGCFALHPDKRKIGPIKRSGEHLKVLERIEKSCSCIRSFASARFLWKRIRRKVLL